MYFTKTQQNSHWREAIQLWGVRAEFHPPVLSEETSAYPYRRKTVQLWWVWESLQSAVQPDMSHANPYRRKTILVWGLRANVPSQGHLQTTPRTTSEQDRELGAGISRSLFIKEPFHVSCRRFSDLLPFYCLQWNSIWVCSIVQNIINTFVWSACCSVLLWGGKNAEQQKWETFCCTLKLILWIIPMGDLKTNKQTPN